MSTRGPRAIEIVLTDDEHDQLERWARRRKSAQALAQRSRIVLLAAAGANNTQIAAQLGVSRPMVTRWRTRFAGERLEGLLDEPRPGPPRTIADERVFEVITRTLETAGLRGRAAAPRSTAPGRKRLLGRGEGRRGRQSRPLSST